MDVTNIHLFAMSNKESFETSDRRSVLKSLGIGTASVSFPTGAVVADPGKRNRPDKRKGKARTEKTRGSPASASMEVDPSTSGMSDRERIAFIERMTEKHGQAAANRIRPSGRESADGEDVRTQGQMPGLSPGELVWDDDEHLEVDNPYGQTLVESDNYAALYETDVHTEDGNDQYYFYWLWSSAQSKDHLNVTGDIREFWNHIDLTNSADVVVYDPGGDKKRNGMTVTVSASVSGQTPDGKSGASAGIQGEFTLAEDVVRPHPNKSSQDSDEFAVQWDSGYLGYEGTQEINGTLVERRDAWDSRGFDWNVYLDGNGV